MDADAGLDNIGSPDMGSLDGSKRVRKSSTKYDDFQTPLSPKMKKPDIPVSLEPVLPPPVPVVKINQKELLMSPSQATQMNKAAKGYAFVPVLPTAPIEPVALPAKRARQIVDFKRMLAGSGSEDEGKSSKKSSGLKKKKRPAVKPTSAIGITAAAAAPTSVSVTTAAVVPVPKHVAPPKISAAAEPALASSAAPLMKKKRPAAKPISRTAPVKPGNPEDWAFCEGVLTKLQTHKYGWAFAEPVDPVKLNIPDYLTIVKTPMDFSTIKGKLTRREYVAMDECLADVRLVFSNCRLYNKPDSDITLMANTLEDMFEERVNKYIEKKMAKASGPATTRPPSFAASSSIDTGVGMSQIDKRMERKLQELSDMMEEMRHVTQKLKRAKQSSAPKVKGSGVKRRRLSSESDSGSSEHEKQEKIFPMDYNEKKRLSNNINKLNPDKLLRVVDIIKESMPNVNQMEQDVVEIDIDSLDNRTLRRLEAYVNQCLTAKAKPVAAAPPPRKKPNPESSRRLQPPTKKIPHDDEKEDVIIDDGPPVVPHTIDHTVTTAMDTESTPLPAHPASALFGGPVESATIEPMTIESTTAAVPMEATTTTTVTAVPATTTSVPAVPAVAHPPPITVSSEAVNILGATLKSEEPVTVVNAETWSTLAAEDTETAKDTNNEVLWARFQARDQEQKLRDREKAELEERQRREREQAEEHARQEAVRLQAEAEAAQRREAEEAQRRREEMRAAERAAREQDHGGDVIDMNEQRNMMASFESSMKGH